MTLTQELIKKHGQEVSLNFIKQNILSNLFITRHAIEKMKERRDTLVVYTNKVYSDGTCIPNYKKIIENIECSINDFILAYINTDGSINVAISEYDYFVFTYDDLNNKWVLVTFKEKSWNNISIFEKKQMALKGLDRK